MEKNLNKEYLLGTGRRHKIINIAKLFNHKIKMIPSRKGERFSSTYINNNSFKILKYKPKIKIESYIKNFVKKYKKK